LARRRSTWARAPFVDRVLDHRFERLRSSGGQCPECGASDLLRPEPEHFARWAGVEGVCGLCGALLALDPAGAVVALPGQPLAIEK